MNTGYTLRREILVKHYDCPEEIIDAILEGRENKKRALKERYPNCSEMFDDDILYMYSERSYVPSISEIAINVGRFVKELQTYNTVPNSVSI